MLRTCSRIILLAAMVASMAAQAADTTLTLACKGTTTDRMKDGSAKKEPLSIGIIVNLTKHTVQGLLLPTSESLPITDVTDLTIDFGGGTARGSIYGTIDRVTGDFSATYFYSNATSTDYALKCSPAQRMF